MIQPQMLTHRIDLMSGQVDRITVEPNGKTIISGLNFDRTERFQYVIFSGVVEVYTREVTDNGPCETGSYSHAAGYQD